MNALISKISQQTQPDEKPVCPYCKCRMILVRVTDHHEIRLYRGPGCGEETNITVKVM